MKVQQIFLFLIVSVSNICFSLSAQESKAGIEFDVTEHDFGTIDYNRPVQFEFTFRNKGTEPLVLSDVKTSCGCTSPEWTREPLMPGKTGSIKVEYFPSKGVTGVFSKTVTVTSNAENREVVLKVKGIVAKPDAPFENYVYSIGKLNVENIHIKFGTIFKGDTQKKTIHIKNSSDEIMKISFKNLPPYLLVRVVPEELSGGISGQLEFIYNTLKSNEWEYKTDRIEVLINGESLPQNVVTVTAEIKENFSAYTSEDLANAPKIIFDSTVFNFGTIDQNKIISHNYTVRNEGKSQLILRKVSATCGCTVVKPVKYALEPGESTILKVQFNSAGKLGDQKYAITVISNDPKNSKKILKLEGTVQNQDKKS